MNKKARISLSKKLFYKKDADSDARTRTNFWVIRQKLGRLTTPDIHSLLFISESLTWSFLNPHSSTMLSLFFRSGVRCSASDFRLTWTPTFPNCIFISPSAFLKAHPESSSLDISLLLYNGATKIEEIISTTEEEQTSFDGYLFFAHEPGTAPGKQFIPLNLGQAIGVNMWSETSIYLNSHRKVWYV